jgi:hypothetical protein
MVKREAKITKIAAADIAAIAWFIESKGLYSSAEKFVKRYLFFH